MVQDRSTPEKKLLELIESPAGGNTLREVKKKRKRIGFISPGALRGRFSFFKVWIGKVAAKQKLVLDIKEINIIFTVLVIGLISYLAVIWVSATDKLNNISNLTSELTSKEKSAPFSSVSLLKDISYYSQRVNSRNIFELDLSTSTDKANGDTAEERIVTPQEELMKLIEYLVLVGVSWSENPVAMIENTDAKTTYFVKKDDEINQGIKIKQIFIDKVILEYKGVGVELKL